MWHVEIFMTWPLPACRYITASYLICELMLEMASHDLILFSPFVKQPDLMLFFLQPGVPISKSCFKLAIELQRVSLHGTVKWDKLIRVCHQDVIMR